MIAKPERHRCPAHLRWVATIPCVICAGGRVVPERFRSGEVVSQAHHVTTAQPKARGLKVSDSFVVPLCVRHHDPNHPGSVHHSGGERVWWERKGVNPLEIAESLWAASMAAGRVRQAKAAA